MKKKDSPPKIYKVLIQKTYRNNEGYIFSDPKKTIPDPMMEDRSFTMIYTFQKIGEQRNPMFVVKSVNGEDFKGRMRIIKHFEESHALSYACEQDGLFEGLNEA